MEHWTVTTWALVIGGLGMIVILLGIWLRHNARLDPLFPLKHEEQDFKFKKEYYEKLTGVNNEGNNNQD